ncbi:cisplatin damage response ATP-dependent DNA ligase [Xanthobacter sp. TB0139]|uniref:cisplatin damage response ATP-dependent DNA ligase n=1 Tax=Xanthobacter sp. TB0139 TaxID=3459178 RepID=UPI00403A76F5
MNRFAALFDLLSREHAAPARLRMMTDYFRRTPDPDRGFALGLLTGSITLPRLSPARLRALAGLRTDPVLFQLSHDYVGDLAETIALTWPLTGPLSQPTPSHTAAAAPRQTTEPPLFLSEIDHIWPTLPSSAQVQTLALWLDRLDDLGRWALLKLLTGGLKPLETPHLPRAAIAALDPQGQHTSEEVATLCSGLEPPYEGLFAYMERRGPRPILTRPAPFHPLMPVGELPAGGLESVTPESHLAEWKWDGLRAELVCANTAEGSLVTRLYSASGEELTRHFPEMEQLLSGPALVDGLVLMWHKGRAHPFARLQKRLERSRQPPQLMAQYPAHFIACDLLEENGEDLRRLPLFARRARLEALLKRHESSTHLSLSPLLPFSGPADLAALHEAPPASGPYAEATRGLLLKPALSPYRPAATAETAEPRWWSWPRAPRRIKAVLLYVQRARHAPQLLEATFGLWRDGTQVEELVPVGKALLDLPETERNAVAHFVQAETINRFGPVREVAHDADHGLVLEIAFEGVSHSTRHRCGLILRTPSIMHVNAGMAPVAAGRLSALQALLPAES